MRSTALTLFSLTTLAPDAPPPICRWCKTEPVTTRVYAIQNLHGLHRTELAANAYRHAFRRSQSSCCDSCARYLADTWWNPTYACPNGTCQLWGHTLTEPHPDRDCTRHHHEMTVVWLASTAQQHALEQAS